MYADIDTCVLSWRPDNSPQCNDVLGLTICLFNDCICLENAGSLQLSDCLLIRGFGLPLSFIVWYWEPLQGHHQEQQLQVSISSTCACPAQNASCVVGARWHSNGRLRHSSKAVVTAGNAATRSMLGRLSLPMTHCCFYKFVLM